MGTRSRGATCCARGTPQTPCNRRCARSALTLGSTNSRQTAITPSGSSGSKAAQAAAVRREAHQREGLVCGSAQVFLWLRFVDLFVRAESGSFANVFLIKKLNL